MRVLEGGSRDLHRRTGDLGVMYRADLVPNDPGAVLPDPESWESEGSGVGPREEAGGPSGVEAVGGGVGIRGGGGGGIMKCLPHTFPDGKNTSGPMKARSL